MDHPNIAHVFDAGDSRHGPTLFVMRTHPWYSPDGVLRPRDTPRGSGWSCSSRFAVPSSMLTRRESSTAISNPPT